MNSTRSYQWLLFDADGTLFDYDLAEAKSLRAAFVDFDLPFGPTTSEMYRLINHQIWQEFEHGQITSTALRTARFERLFERLKMPADADQFSARYLHHLSQASDLIPGAETVLRQLKEHYRLGIITNGLKDIQRPRLNGSPIGGWFEMVAISEEIGAAKPDPLFFETAFERMGRPPRASALVIGDSLSSDIQGGINYGLDTCWFNPSSKPADPHIPSTYQISHLNELLSMLPLFVD